MKALPEFAPYRIASPPNVKRWFTVSTGLLLVMGGCTLALHTQGLSGVAIAGLFFWLLMLLVLCLALRILYYRVAQHNAQAYHHEVDQVVKHWWWRHRQEVGMVDYVLIGAAGADQTDWLRLINQDHRRPQPQNEPQGKALRQMRTFSLDVDEREKQLARMAVLQWRAQTQQELTLQPIHCYWLGSLPAWQIFVIQMAESFPNVVLPDRPEPWNGIESLTAMIDHLQTADDQARVICAGCQSIPSMPNSLLPAGEAATIWLLGQQGRVQFSRGEYVQAENGETVGEAASRALSQSRLEYPPESCFLFTQEDMPALSETRWGINQHVQDLNWGLTGEMEAMVVMTLAAVFAEKQATPCGWLARDPLHSLALGIVKPYGSGK